MRDPVGPDYEALRRVKEQASERLYSEAEVREREAAAVQAAIEQVVALIRLQWCEDDAHNIVRDIRSAVKDTFALSRYEKQGTAAAVEAAREHCAKYIEGMRLLEQVRVASSRNEPYEFAQRESFKSPATEVMKQLESLAQRLACSTFLKLILNITISYAVLALRNTDANHR